MRCFAPDRLDRARGKPHQPTCPGIGGNASTQEDGTEPVVAAAPLRKGLGDQSSTKGTSMALTNKVAIVTGGNSGIGEAIVLELARQGAKIVIDYLFNPAATEALEQQIAKLGAESFGVEADVSKLADLQRLVDGAARKFGRVDIMVNNA